MGFEYKMAIEYLNQFLDEKIDWRWTDIAKLRKSGQFGADFNDECRQVARHVGISSSKKKQNGVVRVNCVDCLDRTNLTQVNIGLVALQDQLGGVFSYPDTPVGTVFWVTSHKLKSLVYLQGPHSSQSKDGVFGPEIK